MDVPGFFANLPPWLGTLPNWITAGSAATILGLFVKWRLGQGQLDINAEQVRVAAKKVEAEDEADLRDHYAQELESLRQKLVTQERNFQDALDRQSKRHDDALMALEERHNRISVHAEERLARSEERHLACEQDRDRLTARVQALEEEQAGLRKQISIQSADQLLILEAAGSGKVTPAALDAAKRIIQTHHQDLEDRRNSE